MSPIVVGPARLIFDVPGTPPNQNAQRGAHWGVIARENAEWKSTTGWAARAAIVNAGGEKALHLPWQQVAITATFHFARPTRRDIGNLAGSLKPVIDSLVELGIFPDDSYVYLPSLTVVVERRLAPKPYFTLEVRNLA